MASRSHSSSVSSTGLPAHHATPEESSSVERAKKDLIITACESRDFAALKDLSTSIHGLVSDDLRRIAWPLLLGCANVSVEQTPWQTLPAHSEEGQVALDVNRAFVYYPSHVSEKELDRRKEELSNVILEVLRRHPILSYFQGYHDIVQVFYLVLGPRVAPQAAAYLSLFRIRDFMLTSLEPAIAQLELLRPLLLRADPPLFEHLPTSSATFALEGTITMFAHNIREYREITRLFDFFLARHPVIPLYFFAAVVLSRREELLEIEKDEEDILHVMLSKLPEPFDIEFHIARSVELYERLPPQSLGSWEWWRISSSSVLKTTANLDDNQHMPLEDGERYFVQQENEVRRQQYQKKLFQQTFRTMKRVRLRLWSYRRYGPVGVALIIGAYAIWVGKNGGPDLFGHPLFGSLYNVVQRVLRR